MRSITCALLVATIFSLILTVPLFAATDGSLGATSTGSSNISLTIPSTVQVTKVDDLAFGTWDASTSIITQADPICIYTSNPSGQYQVTLSGSGANNAFTATDGGTTPLPYRVWFADSTNSVDLVEVTAGVTATGQTGACTNNTSCGQGCGNETAQYEVRLYDTDMLNVHSGNYTGTLSITVEPE